ncbi:MAG: class I SAM-dependent methyltransferase [Pelagibacteraceae bacterium]
MLKRTSINHINEILRENPKFKILDIGCGYTAHNRATTIADVQDFSKFYKDKNFIKINEKKLPFKDKEFDFVIASHVIEHVEDFQFFLKELERISKKGYIELPTRLGDNLVFENVKDHIWWFVFDDVNKVLIASRRNQSISPFLSVSTSKKFDHMFRESMVLELLWEDKIEFMLDNKINNDKYKKISFLILFKKYISKLVRQFIS